MKTDLVKSTLLSTGKPHESTAQQDMLGWRLSAHLSLAQPHSQDSINVS